MKVARWNLILFVVLACAGWMGTVAAEDKGAARGPEQVIRDFYAWYVQALTSERDPFTQDRETLKTYATAHLIDQIDKMLKGPDGLDGDYFLDAQDFDKEWAGISRSRTPKLKTGKRPPT